MLQILLVFIEIVIAYLLQTSVFTGIRMAGIVPDVLLIVVCSMAYTKGRIPGIVSGFVCGLIVDCTFGNVIGLYALMYMTVGYCCGFANKIYDKDDYMLPMILIGVSELVYNIFYFIFFIFLKGNLNIGWFMVKYVFPKVIYTVFLSILLYRLLNMQHLLFEKRKTRKNKVNNGLNENT